MAVASKTVTIPENLAAGYVDMTMAAGHNSAYKVRFRFNRSENNLTVTCTILRVGLRCYSTVINSREYWAASAGCDQTFATGTIESWTSSAVETNPNVSADTAFALASTGSFSFDGVSYGNYRSNISLGSTTVTAPESGSFTVYLRVYSNTGSTAASQEWGSVITTSTREVNIPVYVNVSSAIKKCRKAYANIGGTIKTCAVYTNVGGEIKKIG